MKKRIAVWIGMCAILLCAVGCKSGAKKVYVDVKIDAEHFPDESFRSYISEAFDPDGDGVIPAEEVKQIQAIDCSYLGISDLTGIKLFPALQDLNCSGNKLSKLDVSKNRKLTQLDCEYNQLTELDVSMNKRLGILQCTDNLLTELNLSTNFKLYKLKCTGNSFTYVDISKCGWDIELPDQEGIEFEREDRDADKGVAIDAKHFPDEKFREYVLTMIDRDENGILSKKEALGTWAIALCEEAKGMNDGFITLTELYEYKELTPLGVQDLTGLENFIGLEELYCRSNKLTELDVTKNPELYELHCRNNNLDKLDATKNPGLKYLFCEYNALAELDVTKNPKLSSLHCTNNNLTKLDLSKTLVDSRGLQADEGVGVTWPVLEEETNTAMP